MEGPGEEYPQEVQKNNDQNDVPAPVVNVAHELSEQNITLEMKDGLIGLVRKRLVNEFHQDSRSEQKKNQHHGHTAQSPGQGESEGSLRNGAGPEVQDQAVEKPQIVCTILYGPKGARENGVPDALK